ncbi:MAG: hypothetical protein PW734_11755 [Verrucomicrobium sp.]|nr:hypothetical protein [Verrucomicrobium sp.]
MKSSNAWSESSSKLNKNPFRAADCRGEKPQLHRYERRKVRQLIRTSDWSPEDGG